MYFNMWFGSDLSPASEFPGTHEKRGTYSYCRSGFGDGFPSKKIQIKKNSHGPKLCQVHWKHVE